MWPRVSATMTRVMHTSIQVIVSTGRREQQQQHEKKLIPKANNCGVFLRINVNIIYVGIVVTTNWCTVNMNSAYTTNWNETHVNNYLLIAMCLLNFLYLFCIQRSKILVLNVSIEWRMWSVHPKWHSIFIIGKHFALFQIMNERMGGIKLN